MSQEITTIEKILDKNEQMSRELNQKLTKQNVFFVNLLGSPGAGKTTFLLSLIPLLKKQAFVIEGDIASDIDTQKLNDAGIRAVQINTNGACHLEVPQIEAVLPGAIANSIIFVENIGNLVCPAEFLIGEDVKILLSTVTEGSDKPYKYPLAFEVSDLIMVNKSDITDVVDFDKDYFEKGVRLLNKKAQIIYVSGKTGQGLEEVAAWINERIESKRS